MSKWVWLWLALNVAIGAVAWFDWQEGSLKTLWFAFVILTLITQSLTEIRVSIEVSKEKGAA